MSLFFLLLCQLRSRFCRTAGSFSWRLDEPTAASARKKRGGERVPAKQLLKEWSAQVQCSAREEMFSSSLFPKSEHQGEIGFVSFVWSLGDVCIQEWCVKASGRKGFDVKNLVCFIFIPCWEWSLEWSPFCFASLLQKLNAKGVTGQNRNT